MNLVGLRPSQAINVFPLVPFLYLMLITGMTLSICLVCKSILSRLQDPFPLLFPNRSS